MKNECEVLYSKCGIVAPVNHVVVLVYGLEDMCVPVVYSIPPREDFEEYIKKSINDSGFVVTKITECDIKLIPKVK